MLGEGGSRWINSGAMKNQGFEFNLGYRNKTAFGLTYDLNGNISTYRNEILELPETVAANGKFGIGNKKILSEVRKVRQVSSFRNRDRKSVV